MDDTDQWFLVALRIVQYKVLLNFWFKSVILRCGYLIEHWFVLPFLCSIYLTIQFWDSMHDQWLPYSNFSTNSSYSRVNIKPEKKNSGHFAIHHWFPREMTLEELAQNFPTDDASLPDLRSASDWSCRVGNLLQPIRGTTQIWVVTRHQYRISTVVSQMSFLQGNQ